MLIFQIFILRFLWHHEFEGSSKAECIQELIEISQQQDHPPSIRSDPDDSSNNFLFVHTFSCIGCNSRGRACRRRSAARVIVIHETSSDQVPENENCEQILSKSGASRFDYYSMKQDSFCKHSLRSWKCPSTGSRPFSTTRVLQYQVEIQ